MQYQFYLLERNKLLAEPQPIRYFDSFFNEMFCLLQHVLPCRAKVFTQTPSKGKKIIRSILFFLNCPYLQGKYANHLNTRTVASGVSNQLLAFDEFNASTSSSKSPIIFAHGMLGSGANWSSIAKQARKKHSAQT